MQTSYRVNKGFALWVFGLPASGKTTVSKTLKRHLEKLDVPVVLFDGDVTREIVGEGIGRTVEDRVLLTRRYTSLTSYLIQSRVIVILAAINHTNAQREYARNNHPNGQFGLVWIDTSLELCEARDPKGQYKKAHNALATNRPANMVGIDIDFEKPKHKAIVVHTETEPPEVASQKIVDFLIEAGALQASDT